VPRTDTDMIQSRTAAVQGAALSSLSMRMVPGESVIERLTAELDMCEAGGAAIIAAVGSLRDVTYAVVVPSPKTIATYSERHRAEGTIEIGSLQGHLGRQDDGTAGSHLHGVFVLPDGNTVGGHVFEAHVLLTLEITLLLSDTVWRIRPLTLPGHRESPPGLCAFYPEPAEE